MSDVKTSDVCPKCGWYLAEFGTHRCDERAGKVARDLAREVGERLKISSTQLGYGYGYLVFELDDKTHLRVQPHGRTKLLGVEELYALEDFTPSEVMLLLKTLREIREMQIARLTEKQEG